MTINEIAKMAGVSAAAVSRYLNNGYLSEDKKEIIRKVIEETGYKPSLQAQMMRTKKAKLISVIVTLQDTRLIGDVMLGINEILKGESYDILFSLCNSNDGNDVINQATIAQNRLADGIIIVADSLNEATTNALKALNIPVLLAGINNDSLNCIFYDNAEAAMMVTDALISKGCTKPAYIGLSPAHPITGADRFSGYKNALLNNNIQLDTKLIEICDSTVAEGSAAMERLLEKCPGIDAVFCGSDALSIGAYQFLATQKTRFSINVSGFGNTELAGIINPPLINITIDYCELGKKAAGSIIRLLTENPEKLTKEKLDCLLHNN